LIEAIRWIEKNHAKPFISVVANFSIVKHTSCGKISNVDFETLYYRCNCLSCNDDLHPTTPSDGIRS
jgi:hypothetical protein